ncbi:MAG: NAD-dependent epimerase/dehydratase family protein [Fidelibacterota bacterium]|nr:MAG: NAD-dependent epimerase/dehydratase family protein [Candidatus Neomarinimicrobiota bacterium]
MPPETILITGGCGFLGQHLSQALLTELLEVRLRLVDLHSNPYPLVDLSSDPRVELRAGLDICDTEAIRPIFQDVDVVVHLASLISQSLHDREHLHQVNVLGTRSVLAAASQAGVDLFMHIGSVAALGYNNDPHHPADETFRFDWSLAESRRKYYMLSKHQAGQEVEAYRSQGRAAVILHPGLMFGPGDHRNTAKLIRTISRNRMLVSAAGGNSVVDVRDVARGIVAALQHGITAGDYLLSGWNLSFREIARTIARETGGRPPRIILPTAFRSLLYWPLLAFESIPGNRPSLSVADLDSAFCYRYFDHSRAERDFGWTPAIPFHQSIADAYAWMKDHGLT